MTYQEQINRTNKVAKIILALLFGSIALGIYARIPAAEPISPLGIGVEKVAATAPLAPQKAVVATVESREGDSSNPSPKSEKQQILAYIVEKFGDDAADAITLVRKCENSTFDQSRTNHNSNGSIDYGVFQVNDIHVKKYGESFKTSWKANVDIAYKIYVAAGKKFTPWSCAHVVDQTPFYLVKKNN